MFVPNEGLNRLGLIFFPYDDILVITATSKSFEILMKSNFSNPIGMTGKRFGTETSLEVPKFDCFISRTGQQFLRAQELHTRYCMVVPMQGFYAFVLN